MRVSARSTATLLQLLVAAGCLCMLLNLAADSTEISKSSCKEELSLPLYRKFPVSAPLEPSRPVPVLILSYQRCGSSFFGQLFDRGTRTFYLYEPLDALYTHLYGTEDGWNVPSDIFYQRNGSDRILSQEEKSQVYKYLENLFYCKFREIPLEFFLHNFWKLFFKYQTGLYTFKTCLQSVGLLNARNVCYQDIQDECPRRFGEDPEKQSKCRLQLFLGRIKLRQGHGAQQDNFTSYQACMREYTAALSRCLPTLEKLCARSKYRVIKTVRASMAAVSPLLEHTNARIIHLVRDPRPVAVSRLQYKSFRSIYSQDDMTMEAMLYCRQVVHDAVKRKELEQRYPNRVLTVIYDDFMKDASTYTQEIYKYLGIEFANRSQTWLNGHTLVDKASAWEAKMSVRNSSKIKILCGDFYDTFPYRWS